MTSIRGRGRLHRKRPTVALPVALPDCFLPSKSGDKLFDQPAGPSGTKPLIVNAPATATNVSKYSENDLQRILKAVLEAQTPAPTPALAPALIISEAPWEKLKARSLDVYHGKSYMDCYNFCQQCENYFATAKAMGPTQILFITFLLQDWISFRW